VAADRRSVTAEDGARQAGSAASLAPPALIAVSRARRVALMPMTICQSSPPVHLREQRLAAADADIVTLANTATDAITVSDAITATRLENRRRHLRIRRDGFRAGRQARSETETGSTCRFPHLVIAPCGKARPS